MVFRKRAELVEAFGVQCSNHNKHHSHSVSQESRDGSSGLDEVIVPKKEISGSPECCLCTASSSSP